MGGVTGGGGVARMCFWQGKKLQFFEQKAVGIGLFPKKCSVDGSNFPTSYYLIKEKTLARMVIYQSSMSTGARFLDFLPQHDELRGKLFIWVVWAGPLLTVSQDKLASATPLKDVWSFQQCGPLPKCWFKLSSAILVILLCGGLKTNVLKMSQMINLFSSGLKAPSSICLDYHFLWVVFHLYLRWSLPCSTLIENHFSIKNWMGPYQRTPK